MRATPLRAYVAWLLLVLLNCSLASFGSCAEPTPPGEVQSKEDSKENDIRKLLSITMQNGGMQQVSKQLLSQLRQVTPNVSSEFWIRFESRINLQELTEHCIPIYAKHLTHDQIKGLIQFYESPLGKSFLEATPRITEESIAVMNEWGKRLGAQIVKEINGTTNNPVLSSGDTNRAGKQSRFPNEEVKRDFIRSKGLNPDTTDYDERTYSFVPRVAAIPPLEIPSTVRYLIMANGRSYFSEKEPQPNGTGFKFTSWPEKLEITVTGNIAITKVAND